MLQGWDCKKIVEERPTHGLCFLLSLHPKRRTLLGKKRGAILNLMSTDTSVIAIVWELLWAVVGAILNLHPQTHLWSVRILSLYILFRMFCSYIYWFDFHSSSLINIFDELTKEEVKEVTHDTILPVSMKSTHDINPPSHGDGKHLDNRKQYCTYIPKSPMRVHKSCRWTG